MPLDHILHISDIHIRVGDSERSREQEYHAAFQNLFHQVKAFPRLAKTLIVVTGDLFHNKHLIGPPGIEIAVQLLRGLSELAPTAVIRGNHDYRQDMPDEKDLISALTAYNIPDLYYFNETGCYEIENIGIGLVAIQDALLANSTSGIAKSLPPFPSVADFSEGITHRVALFHGSITRARLQNGTLYDSPDGYPLEWFDEYDLVLLGDIHLQQVNKATKIGYSGESTPYATQLTTYKTQKGTWAYPGSLIQQDFGESMLGHGYLHWDLAAGQVTEYHIHNPYGILKLQVSQEGTQVILQKDTLLPLADALRHPWFPKHLHVRVLAKGIKCNAELLDDVRRGLQDNGKGVLSICEMYAPTVVGKDVVVEDGVANGFDLATLNSPETWKQYILQNCQEGAVLKNNVWHTWFSKPDQLLIPVTGIPQQLVPGVLGLNDKLHKLIEAFRLEVELQKGEAVHGSVVLKQVEWSWLFNYGAKNHFNFAELEGQLVVLNAKNGHGKSNFFEIICLALFGEGFPSRENSHYSTAIINSQIPEGANASSRIVFAVNGKDFCIERVFRIMVGKNNLHHYRLELRSLPSYEIVKEGSLAVKAWLASHIGSKTTFLSSCMLTQDGDCNFFAMETADQKKLIDNVFSLNAVQKLEGLLKESAKVHGSVSTLLSSYRAGVKETKKGEQSVQELTGIVEGLEGRLLELEGEIAMLHGAWNSLSPRTFERDLEEYEAELEGMSEGKKGDLEALKATRAVLKTRVREGAVQVRRPEGIVLNETELRRLPELWREYRALSPDGRIDPELDAMECWRLLKEKEVWTHIWSGFEGGGGEGIAELRSGVQAAENELNRLMYEHPEGIPHKTMGIGGLKKALEKIEESIEGLKAAETFERRIGLLEGVERDYPRLEGEWKGIVAELAKNCQVIQEYEGFPFNPKCDACKAVPWKATLEEAKKRRLELLEEKKRIKPLIESYDNEYGSLEMVRELLTEEREGLNERLTQEELRAQTERWIALAEWIAAERTARGKLDRIQRELRGIEELAEKSLRYEREKAEWSVKGAAAEATLRHHLEGEIAALEHWEQWYAWDTAERLRQVELDIEAAATYARRQELLAIVEAYPAYLDEQGLLEERGDLMVKLQKARDLLEAAGRGGEEVRDALRLIDQRVELLKYLSVAFKDYRKWLYTAKLAPMLQEGVKSLLEHMCEGRPLFLEPEWLDSIDTFTWFLRDGSNRVVIEKASGFQRFITGMAMRVAMSRLGICKVVYENLIIDEGFTACDGEHLEKVPAFLRRLLVDGGCKGILLATHLDELKVRLGAQLRISRDELSGIATLQVGTCAPVAPAVMVNKGKKGKKA